MQITFVYSNNMDFFCFSYPFSSATSKSLCLPLSGVKTIKVEKQFHFDIGLMKVGNILGVYFKYNSRVKTNLQKMCKLAVQRQAILQIYLKVSENSIHLEIYLSLKSQGKLFQMPFSRKRLALENVSINEINFLLLIDNIINYV